MSFLSFKRFPQRSPVSQAFISKTHFVYSSLSPPPFPLFYLFKKFALMGFPCIAFTLTKPIIATILVKMLHHIKFMSMIAIAHLRLFSPQVYSVLQPASFVLGPEHPSPSLVLVPLHIGTNSIKKRLPVVKYGDFIKRCRIEAGKDTGCVVCLNGVEERDEIRELPNCLHVFHKACLESWVDEGQVTCPLCRSLLFPVNREIKRRADPYPVERNEYLFGERL
ncbi:hypothetical protein LguiA_015868 [Lonicera macranthoides]